MPIRKNKEKKWKWGPCGWAKRPAYRRDVEPSWFQKKLLLLLLISDSDSAGSRLQNLQIQSKKIN